MQLAVEEKCEFLPFLSPKKVWNSSCLPFCNLVIHLVKFILKIEFKVNGANYVWYMNLRFMLKMEKSALWSSAKQSRFVCNLNVSFIVLCLDIIVN